MSVPIGIVGNTHVEAGTGGPAANLPATSFYAFLVRMNDDGTAASRSQEMQFNIGAPLTESVAVFLPGGAVNSAGKWRVYTGYSLRRENVYQEFDILASGVDLVWLDSTQSVSGSILDLIPDLAPSYYLGLFTSLYRDKPKAMAWAQAPLDLIAGLMDCLRAIDVAFDPDFAAGAQLDRIGEIVGASRVLPFQPSGSQPVLGLALASSGSFYQVNEALTLLAGDGNAVVKVTGTFSPSYHIQTFQLINPGTGYSTAAGVPVSGSVHGVGGTFDITSVGAVVSPTLSDADYRLLLKAKIAQNQWDGQMSSLYPIWASLFPGGTIAVQDNQNMTADVLCIGAFTSIVKDMISNGLIVPRPEAVQYNYLFPTLPIFGFGGDGMFVSGFDSGHWA